MAVLAKIGLLEHGKVRTDAGTFVVRPLDEGWFNVAGTNAEDSGRVRYHDSSEVLEIERRGVRVTIQFLGETQKTTFAYADHTYEVGTMDFGEISIHEGDRQVVKSHSTVSGVRLTSVDPELMPIERELAFGLALRSSAIDKQLWAEDVVYPLKCYGGDYGGAAPPRMPGSPPR